MSSDSIVQDWLNRMAEVLGSSVVITSGESQDGVHVAGIGRGTTRGDLTGDHRVGSAQIKGGTDGVVGAEASDQVVKVDKEAGTKTTTTTQAALNNKGATGSRSSTTTLTDEVNKESTSVKDGVSAKVDFEKKQADLTISGNTERKKDEKVVSGSASSTTIKVGGEGTGLGRSSSRTERNTEGVAVTKSRSGQVTHKGAEGTFSKTKRHDDGFENSQSVSGGFDAEDRSVNFKVQASQSTKKDPKGGDDDENKTKTSVALSGKVKAYEGSGGEVTAGIDLAHGKWKSGASLTLKQGWKITKNDKGEFEVEWVKGFAFTKSMGAEGKKVGGSVKGKVFDETSFTLTKTFKTQKAAIDWCQLHGQPPLGDSAASARQMAVGSKVQEHDGHEVSADAKLLVYGITVGAEVRWGESTMVLIEKTTETSVIVRYVDIDELGLGASLSAVVGIEVGWSDKDIGFSEASFEIVTEEGGRAFERFRDSGTFPGGKGCKLIRKGKTHMDTDALKLKFGLFDLADSDTVSRTVEVDANGKKTITNRGEANFGGDSPFEFMGKHKEKHAFEAVIVEGETEPTYIIRSEVDSSTINGTGRILKRVADDSYGPGGYGNKNRPEGKWAMELRATPKQIELFMKIVSSGKSNNDWLGHDKGEAESLARALRKSKSMDGKHAALSEFFANTGARGIEFAQVELRNNGGGKMAMNLDLTTWDSKDVWLDAKKYDAFIARVEKVTNYSPAERDDAERMLTELRDLKGETVKRINRLANKGKYLEVPERLRANYVRRLTGLKERVEDQMKYLKKSLEELPGGVCTPEDDLAKFHTEQAQLWIKQAQAEMDFISRARHAAKESDRAHGWDGLGGGFRRADHHEEWGFNPSMAKYYKKKYFRASKHMKQGDKDWEAAADAVDNMMVYGNHLLNDPTNEELFMILSETFTDSMQKIREIANHFESAYNILHEIYSKHKDHVGFKWKTYPPPPKRSP